MEKDYLEPSPEEIDRLYSGIPEKEAKQGGYNLSPDGEFVKGLGEGGPACKRETTRLPGLPLPPGS